MGKYGGEGGGDNGYIIYVDIITGEKCRQIRLLTWASFIGQFVHAVKEDRVNWVDWGIVILATYEFHFPVVHDNLV